MRLEAGDLLSEAAAFAAASARRFARQSTVETLEFASNAAAGAVRRHPDDTILRLTHCIVAVQHGKHHLPEASKTTHGRGGAVLPNTQRAENAEIISDDPRKEGSGGGNDLECPRLGRTTPESTIQLGGHP